MDIFIFWILGLVQGIVITLLIVRKSSEGGYQPDGRGRKLNPNPPQGGTARTPRI